MLFKDFLQALRDCGDTVVADEVEKANIAKFKGTLTIEQLMGMDMHTINGVLNMEKHLKQILLVQQHKQDESPLNAYLNSLYVRGFCVAVNPVYQHLLNLSSSVVSV